MAVVRLEMPPHWKTPRPKGLRLFSGIKATLFQMLCAASFGQSTLDDIWNTCNSGEGSEMAFKATITNMAARTGTTNIVGGLLLATTAVFLSTDPPINSINWLAPFPYVCLFFSFAFALGGLFEGTIQVVVLSSLRMDYFLKDLTKSRARLCCVLFLVSWPMLAIGLSTIVFAAGIFIAALLSVNKIFVASAAALFALQFTIGVIKIWSFDGHLWILKNFLPNPAAKQSPS
ncbi:hypothetical protein B0H34DRAFT_803310 [Crassisporium funariophilum]|nr:hypothetical protein B0H34DRAFT_803310 [Crassisporium funariophilum]